MSEHPYLDRKLDAAFNKLEVAAQKAVERLTPAGFADAPSISFVDGCESRTGLSLSRSPISLLVQGVGYNVSRIEYARLYCFLDAQGTIVGLDRFSAEPLRNIQGGGTFWREISRETYRNTVHGKVDGDDITVSARSVKDITAPIDKLTKLCKQLRAPSLLRTR